MISWNDYRYVLAISRAGNIPSAASQLAVNTSTVFRRLEKIEELYAIKLFERHRQGYIATEAGQEIIAAAERMEQEAFTVDRALTGKDQQLTGRLRITTTETLAASFLSRHIPSFSQENPGLYVEIISDNQRLSLTEREADIALRPTRPKEETLIGRKIGTLNWGIYGSRLCYDNKSFRTAKDLTGHRFIAWGGGPLAQQTTDWIKRNIPDARIVYESSSMITNAQLAANGSDLTLLPCLTGSRWQGLTPLLRPLEGTEGELWLVTHKDLQKNARVRALLDYLVKAAKEDGPLFEGKDQEKDCTRDN
ncbi:LysR family transcriptional regulator [Kiloniella antarctica]|uniref:LysR family transcriptional regulator n=1 Tax=Kiloniella antarctica TaxID=1550907 RepID=A0ABW5BIE5_9PROT